MVQRVAHGEHVPLGVVAGDDGLPYGMHEAGVPLRAKPRAAAAGVPGDPLVVLQILGDDELPRLPAANLAVDALEQSPAVRQIATRIAVVPADVTNEAHRVEAQPIDMIFVQPVERIVADV